MRHSRADEFEQAIEASAFNAASGRWSERSKDPNAATVLALRAGLLRAAWRAPILDRGDFLVERARGRRVLDLGCVAHDIGRMRSPSWLHGRLAAVADSCVGVDVLEEGVAEMALLGYTGRVLDLSAGPGPLAQEAPFDLIVAGELIEHMESVGTLFELARQVLADDGELVITTPNPWAPHRVRAGQLGYVWENVDHVLFAFPSGIAELAERHGMRLVEAMTTRSQVMSSPSIRRVVRRLRGASWMSVGFSTTGAPRLRRIDRNAFATALARFRPSRPRFLGETFVYVLSRAS